MLLLYIIRIENKCHILVIRDEINFLLVVCNPNSEVDTGSLAGQVFHC